MVPCLAADLLAVAAWINRMAVQRARLAIGCAEELRQANVGDIRTTADGAAAIHVKRKGGKELSVPIEAELLSVIEGWRHCFARPGVTRRLPDPGRQADRALLA